MIQDTASSATLCAILVARERATGWQANEEGLARLPAARLLRLRGGPFLGREGDHDRRASAAAACARSRPTPTSRCAPRRSRRRSARTARRARPAGVVASLGTHRGRRDRSAAPDRRALPRARALPARGCRLGRQRAAAGGAALDDRGHRAADSFVFNPHKWLLTNFDCSAHFVRDPDAWCARSRSCRLPHSRETGQVIDYRDWGVPLGRRFRALKLWFVLRSYGVERLQAMLRDHIAWTAELAGRIRGRARLRADHAAQPRTAHLPLPPAGDRRRRRSIA